MYIKITRSKHSTTFYIIGSYRHNSNVHRASLKTRFFGGSHPESTGSGSLCLDQSTGSASNPNGTYLEKLKSFINKGFLSFIHLEMSKTGL